MNIAHVTGEAAPFVQTGGLGTFVEKLASAQAADGHTVRICVPLYLLTDRSAGEITDTGIRINVSAGEREYEFAVHSADVSGVEYLFFANSELFSRGGIYGSGDFDYSDNDLRYAVFSQACLFYFAGGCSSPDILHCHNWQAGLVPLYNSLLFRDMKWKTVFTVHDVQCQGFSSGWILKNSTSRGKCTTLKG
ncbi:MAG: glycogen/starch synthase [Geovibrio sp.]|nr:glycogen/starch synthase [Geovibrio sp.]